MSEDQLRQEISELRQKGCMKAGEHAKAVQVLETTVKQHDQRIVQTEKDVTEINTKLDALPEQVAQKVNGRAPAPRSMVPLNIGLIKTRVPASWIGWAFVFIAGVVVIIVTVWFHNAGSTERQEFMQKVAAQIERLQATTNGITFNPSIDR